MTACSHRPRSEHLVVVDRLCNYSAFNGYRWTPSDYSCVRCLTCGARWRTRAAYVADLPDATEAEAIGA